MKNKRKTLVVNLFGGPGCGKSTGAAYIFAMLKMRGIEVELVTEFAKDAVWEERGEVFTNQAYIFGKQSYRMSRCDGKVDVIVTDSPLLLSIIYNNDERLTENFNKSVLDVFNSYNNVNFFLRRSKPYDPNGRLQTEEEAKDKDWVIYSLLRKNNISAITIEGNIKGYDEIVDRIVKTINS